MVMETTQPMVRRPRKVKTTFRVVAGDGRRATIHAPNWLSALAALMEKGDGQFVGALDGSLAVEELVNGSRIVRSVTTGNWIRIQPVDTA